MSSARPLFGQPLHKNEKAVLCSENERDRGIPSANSFTHGATEIQAHKEIAIDEPPVNISTSILETLPSAVLLLFQQASRLFLRYRFDLVQETTDRLFTRLGCLVLSDQQRHGGNRRGFEQSLHRQGELK